MADAEVRKKLEDIGVVLHSLGPDEFAKLMAADTARWRAAMRLANVEPQ